MIRMSDIVSSADLFKLTVGMILTSAYSETKRNEIFYGTKEIYKILLAIQL